MCDLNTRITESSSVALTVLANPLYKKQATYYQMSHQCAAQ